MQTILPHAHRSKPRVSIPPGIARPISSPLRTLFQKFSADPITPRPHQTALAEQVTQILAPLSDDPRTTRCLPCHAKSHAL